MELHFEFISNSGVVIINILLVKCTIGSVLFINWTQSEINVKDGCHAVSLVFLVLAFVIKEILQGWQKDHAMDFMVYTADRQADTSNVHARASMQWILEG